MKKSKYKIGDEIMVIKPTLGFKVGDIGIVTDITFLEFSKTQLIVVKMPGNKVKWNFYPEEIDIPTKLHKALL